MTDHDPNALRERALREWLGNKVTHGPRDYAFRAGWDRAWAACNEVAQVTIRELTEELESLERDLDARRARVEELERWGNDLHEQWTRAQAEVDYPQAAPKLPRGYPRT